MPIPALGSSTSSRLPTSSKRNPSAPPARHVPVELVRVGVICDVEIEPSVAVDVREHRTETVTHPVLSMPAARAASRNVDCPLSSGSFVEVEKVANRLCGRTGSRTPGRRRSSGRCRTRRRGQAARRRSTSPTAAADASPCRRCRPAGRLAEGPVALVPEQRVPTVRRDVVAALVT